MGRSYALPHHPIFLIAILCRVSTVEAIAATTGNQCQQADGSLQADKPGGDSCQDEEPTCVGMFGPGATGPLVARTIPGRARRRGEIRDDSCDVEANKVLASKCAYTCAQCCLKREYSCENDKSTAYDCAANEPECRNPQVRDIVERLCPANCGVCGPVPGPSGCADKYADCKSIQQYCNETSLQAQMGEICADTCGLCDTGDTTQTNGTGTGSGTGTSTGGGGNLASNCEGIAYLCNNSAYHDVMMKECAETCRKNNGTVVSPPPTDTSTASDYSSSSDEDCYDSGRDCAMWARNGFCTSRFYTERMKEEYCAYTCEYC